MATTTFATLSFEEKLDRLALVAVRVGLNLRKGQEVVLSASVEQAPFVRRVVEQAYRAGATLVTVLYGR